MAWLPLCMLVLCISVGGCSARNLGRRNDHGHKKLTQRSYDPFHDECGISEAERQQCGAPTADERECTHRACCFDADSTPSCFLAKRMLHEQCLIGYQQKDDCGYYGINEGECLGRECCWAPSPRTNDPPCFHSKTVRLVEGIRTNDSLSGRVEIFYDGEWGTVCDDDFDTSAAIVVCKSLGYTHGEPYGNAPYGEGTGPILLDGMRCTGDEDKLEDCPNNGWGVNDCGHSEDSGAVCINDQPEDYQYPSYPYEYYEYPYEYEYEYEYEYPEEEEEGDRHMKSNAQNQRKTVTHHARRPPRKRAHLSKLLADLAEHQKGKKRSPTRKGKATIESNDKKRSPKKKKVPTATLR